MYRPSFYGLWLPDINKDWLVDTCVLYFFRCILSMYTQYLWPISLMQCFYRTRPFEKRPKLPMPFPWEVNSSPTRLLSCCTDEVCAHVRCFHLLSKQWLCDISSEPRCLGSPYVLRVCILNIRTSMQDANAMLKRVDSRGTLTRSRDETLVNSPNSPKPSMKQHWRHK